MAKDTEQLILEVARKHFVQRGYAATRMQEIADEAGINKALLHYYFRSKEKLYDGITVRILDTVMPRFAEAMRADGDFWHKVEKLVDTYLQVLQQDPDIPIFIMGELSQQQAHFVSELQKRTHLFPAMQDFMGKTLEAMAAGEIRQMAPAHLLLNIMGLTVFPFMARPIFTTLLDMPTEGFMEMMRERKGVIMDFLRQALTP
jgi:TetR/AcrR family transcriptional regulator